MEIVANIWDQVLVVDDLIDLKVIDEYATHLESLGEYTLTYVEIDKNKVFDAGTGVFETLYDHSNSEYSRLLLNSSVIPKLPNHKISYTTTVHKMHVGSLMAVHTDHLYSIAVTTYTTNCVGGELVVENCETGELGKIEPKRGRTIILKCDTPHSVLEVKEGERKSLQTFITYIKEDNDE